MFRLKRVSEDETQVRLTDCIDYESTGDYVRQFGELFAGNDRTITLDLGALGTINRTTVESIVVLDDLATRFGKNLQIKGCNDEVAAMFTYLNARRLIRFT
jgi:anti-anti-sigma regulatory factor